MNRVWINREKRRYYRVVAQLDLFGDWTLVRSWGSLDSHHGQVCTELISTYELGQKVIEDISKRRAYRGYLTR
jgi:hypothetical protein